MTYRRPAPCGGPLLIEATGLRLYHAREQPGEGAEHSHDDIQLAFPLSGPIDADWGTATGDRRRMGGSPGSLLIVSAEQPHAIRVSEETELATVWLSSTQLARTADALSASGGGRAVEIVNNGWVQDPLLQHLCLSLVSEARGNGFPSAYYVDAAAGMLAAHLVRHYASATLAAGTLRGGLSPSVLRRVRNYIGDKLDSGLSLSNIAAQASLSPDHFARLFRQSTGQSPHRYVLAQQLARGKDLLSHSELSVAQIAAQIGFYDQSHFTRQFRKATGVSPGEYRRQTGQNATSNASSEKPSDT